MSRQRRDPRAEREAMRIEGNLRPRFGRGATDKSGASGVSGAEMGASDGRPRRDPREQRRLLLVPGTLRPRLDRLHYQNTSPATSVAMAPTAEPSERIRLIAEPAYLVAVVPDAPGGRLTAHDRQLLGAARLLADAGGGAVLAIVTLIPDGVGAAGADRVLPLSHPAEATIYLREVGLGVGYRVTLPGEVSDEPHIVERIVATLPDPAEPLAAISSWAPDATAASTYDPDIRASAIASALDALSIRHALFAETAEGGDLARRVAARLGEDLFAGAESLSSKLVTRAAKGRRVEQRRAPPRLISLIADAVAPHGGDIHEARLVEPPPIDMTETESAILSAEIIPADPAGIALSEAEFVVSAGNGVTDIATFLALAKALRATPGASRMLCDAGLMPRAAQVGASGTVLGATCYLALGIAGAPQHLQGVAACEHVVAVNTDLHAAMVERAGLAIIADAQTVMPALIAALNEEKAT